MPWTTLELDRTTATERDVKRAYARRLKTCRPDQDPEGFRKLHDAYIAALEELQWQKPTSAGSEASASPVSVSESPPSPQSVRTPENTETDFLSQQTERTDFKNDPTPAKHESPPELSQSRAVLAVLDQLTDALKSESNHIPSLLREAEAIIREHPNEIILWGERLSELIQKYPEHPDLRLTPGAILFELQHQGNSATIAVIERMDRQGNKRAIASLTSLLHDHEKEIATPAGGLAAARLAAAAAFWEPRHTSPLSDLAYATLARGERDYYMAHIDHHSEMRAFLRDVPEAIKSFIRQRLMNQGGREVWDSEAAELALSWLNTTPARSSPIYQAMLEKMPEDLVKKLNSQHQFKKFSSTESSGNTGAPSKLEDYGQPKSSTSRKSTWPPPSSRPKTSTPPRTQIPQPTHSNTTRAQTTSSSASWLDEENQTHSQRNSRGGNRPISYTFPQPSNSSHKRRSFDNRASIIGIIVFLFVIRLIVFVIRSMGN